MKILTANRLLDGEVVWLGPGNVWVESVCAAHVIETEEELNSAMEHASESVNRMEVIETYALDVTRENGAVTPKTTKERIRAIGPTVRTDLGKQAGEQALVA